MPTTSRIGVVVAALRGQLAARDGLLGVTVNAFPQNPDNYSDRHIVLMSTAEGSFEFRGMPLSKRSETFTITGALEVRVPGAGDDKAQEALDTALAIQAEIEAQLLTDPSVDGTCQVAEFKNARHRVLGDASNRVHVIEFDIEFMALIG